MVYAQIAGLFDYSMLLTNKVKNKNSQAKPDHLVLKADHNSCSYSAFGNSSVAKVEVEAQSL